VAAGRNLGPDLDEACRIARICEAIIGSSETGARIDAPVGGVTSNRTKVPA
jgi:hypothetical protein